MMMMPIEDDDDDDKMKKNDEILLLTHLYLSLLLKDEGDLAIECIVCCVKKLECDNILRYFQLLHLLSAVIFSLLSFIYI